MVYIEASGSYSKVFLRNGDSVLTSKNLKEFEEMLSQSAKQPLVCGIALHTMIVGQPYRLRALRRALKYIVEHPQRDKIWFTRPGEIYDHCAALGDKVMPKA